MSPTPIRRIKRDLQKAAKDARRMKPEQMEALAANALSLINEMCTELAVVWEAMAKISDAFDTALRHVKPPPRARKKNRGR
jgi:hypothetical protein